MRQRHRRNRVPMVRHPAAHQGYRRSRHAPSRNGLTRQHPERRLSTTLLLEKQSAVDNNRRYVSPRVRMKSFARASAGISPGQIFQKEVSLPTLLTYRRLLSTKGVFREEGVAFTCLSPIKKAKLHTSFPPAPSARSFVRALVPACSYIPAPVPHPRVFDLPSAHNPRLRFFVQPQRSLRALAFSVRPDPVRRMIPSVRPSARPFTMPQPRFALSQFLLP